MESGGKGKEMVKADYRGGTTVVNLQLLSTGTLESLQPDRRLQHGHATNCPALVWLDRTPCLLARIYYMPNALYSPANASTTTTLASEISATGAFTTVSAVPYLWYFTFPYTEQVPTLTLRSIQPLRC